jgi:hypothetical protein
MGQQDRRGATALLLPLLCFLSAAGQARCAPQPEAAAPDGAALFLDPAAFFNGPLPTTAAAPAPPPDMTPPRTVTVWGLAELRGYAFGQQVAPNGLEFSPLFRLEMDFNVWLWPSQRLYLFGDARFWAQRAAPGVTNASQGMLDFSKREFDLNAGLAWNFSGPFELRGYLYSFNNLNRGDSLNHPSGYADGTAVEARWYLSDVYAALGTEGFDLARATYLSVGFYPSKDMVDGNGVSFKPGPFLHAFLTWDLLGERLYLYGDGDILGTRSCTPKLFNGEAGLAARPWASCPGVELRVGVSEMYDLRNHESETGLYVGARVVF